MILHQLSIDSFRNLKPLTLALHPRLNVFWGDNGSGKTSLLEAVYLLAMGRSFRTSQINHIIEQNADMAFVRALVYEKDLDNPWKASVAKRRDESLQMKWGEQPVAALAEMTKRLPAQLLNTESYQLLQAAPEIRRKLLDWAVFHVEHSYGSIWKQWQQILKQRNAALKQHAYPTECWDTQLAALGERVDDARQRVMAGWLPLARQMVQQAIAVDTLSIEYEPGWDKKRSLLEAMAATSGRDKQLGYTGQGPQRADLQIKIDGLAAHHRLSLGQQKRLICALLLSQNQWIAQQTGEKSLLLIDDLPSELDVLSYETLFQLFAPLEAQIFITSVTREKAEVLKMHYDLKMFHVEHGNIQETL